ncbi:MAG: hypothetical protein KAI64_03830, partial [Thermoplasmata archaeon]|nr:hypothetical protein [Thermoplasmata archaeon]
VGHLETEDYTPLENIQRWQIFEASSIEPTNTQMTFWYSTNSGTIWTQIIPGQDLNGVPIPTIKFRANLTTADTSQTPVILELNVTFFFFGNLVYFYIVPQSPSDLGIGDSVNFTAYGFDSYGNNLSEVPVFWGVNGQIGSIDMGPSTNTTFTALSVGMGAVIADDGLGHWNTTAFFNVTIEPPTQNAPPAISGLIPNQIRAEDMDPWSMNLTGFAFDDGPISDLKWFIAGTDESIYNVLGENVTGNHLLTFNAWPNAFGNDLVTISLEDSSGLRDSQDLWINITPVNDPPVIQALPALIVEIEKAFIFDYSPYISDIDNDLEELDLAVDDQFVAVDGLVVTYYYPAVMNDRTVRVRLEVSDGMDEVNVDATVYVVSQSIIEAMGWDSIMLLSFWALLLLGVILTLVFFVPFLRGKRQKGGVEDIFVIHKDGRLIAHNSKLLVPNRDEDILSGMLTAIQEFIKDAMGRKQVMQSVEFQFEDRNVLIERGRYIYMAIFVGGEPPSRIREQMLAFLLDVEEAYSDVIPRWTGDVAAFRGIRVLMNKLFVGRGYRRGYWRKLKYLGPT